MEWVSDDAVQELAVNLGLGGSPADDVRALVTAGRLALGSDVLVTGWFEPPRVDRGQPGTARMVLLTPSHVIEVRGTVTVGRFALISYSRDDRAALSVRSLSSFSDLVLDAASYQWLLGHGDPDEAFLDGTSLVLTGRPGVEPLVLWSDGDGLGYWLGPRDARMLALRALLAIGGSRLTATEGPSQ